MSQAATPATEVKTNVPPLALRLRYRLEAAGFFLVIGLSSILILLVLRSIQIGRAHV